MRRADASTARRFGVAAFALMFAACSWSNSLYLAKAATHDAERAEREHRPGEASQLWASAALKADSAFARSPKGKKGAEALWVAGHADARSGDCAHATEQLSHALIANEVAPWRAAAMLDLARCEESTNPRDAADLDRRVLASAARDLYAPALASRARAFLVLGAWDSAFVSQQGDTTRLGRLDRATALAHLDRTDSAYTELRPLIVASDTLVLWLNYATLLSAHRGTGTDSLLAALMLMKNVRPETQSSWVLAAARAAAPRDSAAAARDFALLASRPAGASRTEGFILQLQLRLQHAANPDALHRAVDASDPAQFGEGSLARARLTDLRTLAARMLDLSDSTPAGSPRGDLRMFLLGEFARDSLNAPQLGSSFFRRIERDWSDSPYRGKAMLAQAQLEPDSAATLLARLQSLSSDPYLRAANGNLAAQLHVAHLEDSLDHYARSTWASATASRALDNGYHP